MYMMNMSTRLLTLGVFAAATLPAALAWGAMGHETIAYVAASFVAAPTKSYFQALLGDTSADYLASVAAWADSYRYTAAGKYSAPYHFIDANDDPPASCGVDLHRDCGGGGCVVTAIANFVRDSLCHTPSLSLSLSLCRVGSRSRVANSWPYNGLDQPAPRLGTEQGPAPGCRQDGHPRMYMYRLRRPLCVCRG